MASSATPATSSSRPSCIRNLPRAALGRSRGSTRCKVSKQDHQYDTEREVQRREDEERSLDVRGGRYGIARAHHAVDNPGLAADLGHDPPGLEREEAKLRAQHQPPE